MTQRFDITLTPREHQDVLFALAVACRNQQTVAGADSLTHDRPTKNGRIAKRKAASLSRTRGSIIRKISASIASNR